MTGRWDGEEGGRARLALFASGMRQRFGARARAVATAQAEDARRAGAASAEAWTSVLRTLDG